MNRRKDGLWVDTVAIPGSSKRKYFYGKSKAEVKKKIAEWNAEQEAGISLSAAIDNWLAWKEKSVSFKTLEGYRSPIAKINDSFGDLRLNDISPAQIQSFVNSLASKGLKRSAVQRPLDVLRMVYDYHITLPGSQIKYNPCAGVRLPSGLKQEARELASRSDVELVKAGLALPFGLFPYLIMYSGLRDGEALALTDSDFDFKANTISVTKSVSWQTNKPVIKTTKTANGIRNVVLLTQLKKALPKWKGYLFSADGGQTPLTNTQFRSRWNAYCRAAGLADCKQEKHKSPGKNKREYVKTIWTNRIVPYQLRHEFATLCFDAGLDPKSVGDMMGHADEEMARRIYTHIQESRRISDAEKLQKYLDGDT